MARPEKWKDAYLKIAEAACKLGATDSDLADMLGVSLRTIYNWRATKPKFAKIMVAAKQVADARVERSLYTRAVGYDADDMDIRVVGGMVVQTPIKKHYPPDTTACIFWLKNRDKDNWRSNPEDIPPKDVDKATLLAELSKRLPD